MKRLRNLITTFLKQYWVIVTILAAFVVLRIIVLLVDHNAPPAWDAAVYVGMGKYLFSHGTIGNWELLRPVGLPILLGFFWKIGINPYTAGSVLSLIISTGLLVVVYLFAERVYKTSGAIATTLLAASSFFFYYSAIPVTDISSTFFAVLSLYLVFKADTNRQYFIAGIIVALAFMFRFPQGLLLVVAMLAIFIKLFHEKGKWGMRTERFIERGFTIAGGFFVIVIPYLICNQLFYQNAFLPFIEGTAVIKQYPSLYQKEWWFYGLGLLKQNPLYVLALFPVVRLYNKKYRSLGIIMLSIAAAIVAAYFTQQGHKEARYMLSFLPYIAILAGIGIVYVLERFKLPQLAFFGLVLIVGFMISAPLIVHPPINQDNKQLYDFDTYLSKAPAGARVLTTSPALFAYTDAALVRNLYSDWNDAYMAYTNLHDKADFMVLNSCNLETGCADNARCKDDKELLLKTLATKDINIYTTTTPSQCVLSIYQLNH